MKKKLKMNKERKLNVSAVFPLQKLIVYCTTLHCLPMFVQKLRIFCHKSLSGMFNKNRTTVYGMALPK